MVPAGPKSNGVATHKRSAIARRTVPCRGSPVKRTAMARFRVAASFFWLLPRLRVAASFCSFGHCQVGTTPPTA